MNAVAEQHLTLESLARLIQEVEPAALLVSPRILRRVIKQHCGIGGPGLRVPHRKSYILPRTDLLAIATPDELDLRPGQDLPDVVLLFPSPGSSLLAVRPAGEVLLRYWRLLFHSEIHRAFHHLRLAGRLDEASVRERIARIGVVEFEEARAVLHQENYLLTTESVAPGHSASVYEEFAAVYLELLYFDPHRRQQFFPAIVDNAALEAVLAEDVDSGAVFRRTRLPGALDPEHDRPAPSPESAEEPVEDVPETASLGWLRARADLAAQRGNQVRAAILRQRAVPLSPAGQAGGLRAKARQDVIVLVNRLHAALRFPESKKADWSRCLLALLGPASQGVWNREARLLYDLQKVCVDHERKLFAVDLVEWVVSWFHRPIKRPLPDQPLVLTVQHLRTAFSRLPVVRMPNEERRQLSELVQSSLEAAEARLRQTLGPKLAAALDAVQLTPATAAERLERDKLVEECLDRVVETGHLSIGDLRDALARNRLKLPDLRGPVEFFSGDPLIRLNRRLAADLDGIYHRGEIYLRWLQRLSSLFFGNSPGRMLTLFLILPVLGSLFILKGIDGLSEEGHHFFGSPEIHLYNAWSFTGLALFLLPMLHFPAFRRGVWQALYLLWRGVRGVLYDVPDAFLHFPLVRRILQSRPFIVFYQYLGKPAMWTAPVTLVLYLAGASTDWLTGVSAGVLLLMSVLINTRLGMVVEEAAVDRLVNTWEMVRNDLLPGLFRWIVWVFRRVREYVEQGMYTVDEWLRFREGESRLAFAAKLILGLVWSAITYVVRFVINLLIEPQINPIKHFPVVTVSHKLMLLLLNPIVDYAKPILGLSRRKTEAVVALGLGGIPGIFGFLAWELKENWRLYRANQSPTLDPVMVGSHGEQVIQLIRPGFHAGTLPKLFARIRRAKGAAERKGEEGLHHVEESLWRFVDRDLIALLSASSGWGSSTVVVSEIHLATNRIRIELSCPGLGGQPMWLDFANRFGFLTANIARPGFLVGLNENQRQTLENALAGFYKKAGVILVREEVDAVLPAGSAYEVACEGLTVWLDVEQSRGAVYDLGRPESPPRRFGSVEETGLPANAKVFLFSERPILWTAWVEQWERDQAGKGLRMDRVRPDFGLGPSLLPDVRLLPRST